jgi:hypothetical protein
MKRKKLFIIGIVVTNLLFIWSIYNMFYYKKESFNTTEKVTLNANLVNKIYNGNGGWIWNNRKYDFYKEYTFTLNKNEIIEFCNIISTSKAKYIENIRPIEWFDIYIEEKSGNEKTITLKHSSENEIYFEIEHKTFEGKKLEMFLQKHTKQAQNSTKQ